MAVYIGSTASYMRLDSWRMAKIIQLATFKFCRRYFNRSNDPDGKQFGQTTGAARAVPANIAEGSARHQTSAETEMKLLDVARASLSEVIDDIMFLLIVNNLPVWREDDERYAIISNFRLSSASYSQSLLHDVTENIKRNYSHLQSWIENNDLEICLNSILILCTRVVRMLRIQMEKRLELFEEEGGFRENMNDSRLLARDKQLSQSTSPKCPKCGSNMEKRLIKSGVNAGRQFWGCSKWRISGCSGKIFI